MILRPYQNAFVESVFNEWKDNASTVGVLPTGCGKTICFGEVARRSKARVMVIAHRQELIWQARDKIERMTGMTAEVEMGDCKTNEGGLFKKSPIVVSTVQTHVAGGDGGGRMSKFDPMEFDQLIIDEAHHAVSPSYRRILDYYRQNPDLRILGVTATPDRADEAALGQVFDTVAYDYEILDAIRDGWLLPIEQQMVSVNSLDFSSVRTTAGDLNGADLAAVMESEKNLQGVASSSIDIIGSRRAIAFSSSVNHARILSEIFNRHRSGMAAWVCGETDDIDRKRILSEFQAGKIQVVCNCGVLTEGFDDPGVEVILMARPTKSRALYAQMLGRSTRPLPGVVDGPTTSMARRFAIKNSAKPSCLAVDFVGNSGKHKLISTVDILGGEVSEDAMEQAMEFAKRTGKPMRMDAVLKEEEERIQQERERKRLEDEARRQRLTAKAQFSTQSVDPFDLLQIRPVKLRGWDEGKDFTEKQAAMLRRNGVNPDAISYSQGKQLMAAMGQRREEGLCSLNQLIWLKKFRVEGAEKKSFSEASAILDTLFKRKKPAPMPAMAGMEDSNAPF